MQRRTVHFSGHVQGVGFRFAAHEIARGYDVTGYVRNLDDGQVELVAEGEPSEIDRLVAAIRHRMGQYVRNVEHQSDAATGEFHRFEIRH
jgi:acylphosphatase